MFLSIMKKIAPVPRLLDYKSFLFVGPHPDDIEVACGSTVARLIKLGKKVSFVIATDGCVGSIDQTIPKAELIAMRQAEATASANLLGVSDIKFLPFEDGGMYDVRDMTKAIAKEIIRIQPEVILTTDHKVPTECHPDHLKVGEATTNAYIFCPWRKLAETIGSKDVANPIVMAYYCTDKPNTYIKIDKEDFDKRFQSIKCHKSQFCDTDIELFHSYFTFRAIRFGWRRGGGKRDGYRALAPLHTHCFPEASEFNK
ncbi:MAG: PIG-L deacetylase family protein [Clostridia bacterium]